MESVFRFNLQKVLDIRLQKEEESKRLFQQTQKEKANIENSLRELNENFENHKSIKNGETGAYQKIKRNYLNALAIGIKNKENELAIKEEELKARRNDLKQKQIDRKTVEILKEKKFSEFIAEQNRIEQITNDEFALYSHIRRFERR